MKALKLLGLMLALAGAKLWLSATIPWFVGLALIAGGTWLFLRPPGQAARGRDTTQGNRDGC